MEEDLDSPTDVSPPPSRQNPDPAPSQIPRPLPPAALQNKDGGIGMAISRPTQIPQWPLPGPIPSPSPEAEPYRPPPGRGPPPQRPPRPNRTRIDAEPRSLVRTTHPVIETYAVVNVFRRIDSGFPIAIDHSSRSDPATSSRRSAETERHPRTSSVVSTR
ncbi:hypothetical protein COL26b_001820 [Colletotrichum chrysophilum]|uniref:uncharacterized protein n=1 Tax=Colletotrichum chrysophilum TaxID=1836956 RepID=UPI002301F0D5|nr:uncharacterized protein COL26b_001820 [Colletotrichum chrysophilum]KAJ0380000.1 hypothetical protein COL26b_001820 [Colletotrichum chrysophilum]